MSPHVVSNTLSCKSHCVRFLGGGIAGLEEEESSSWGLPHCVFPVAPFFGAAVEASPHGSPSLFAPFSFSSSQ